MRTLIHAALAASLISAPIAATAAAVETGQERLERLTAGLKAGRPVDCIDLGMTRGDDSRRLPGIGIAYRLGSSWYVNRFDGDCPQLRQDTVIVTRLHSSQLCRGDIADLRMSGGDMPVGNCVFGAFTPYTRP